MSREPRWASGGGDGTAGSGGSLSQRPRTGIRWLAPALALLGAFAAAVGLGLFRDGGDTGGTGGRESTTSLATVQRRTLARTTQFNGVLGYAGAYRVLGRAAGTVTSLPAVGRVITQAHVLYRVDDVPVVLLYGATPAFRDLAEGVTGPDAAQLNHDLVALGDAARSNVDGPWNTFSWATKAGVEKLQRHLGARQTGELLLRDVVFLPTAARVTELHAALGAPATGPVLQATSTEPIVRVALDPDLRADVKAGDRVAITLPDGRITAGRVASVAKVAGVSNTSGSDGGPTVPVEIRPSDPRATGGLDQALVEVAITDERVRNALAVPVDALLARSGGGYSVEVVAGDGTHHLVRVRLGLFDDAAGMVQASGPGLAAGQRVVVPGDA